MKNEGVYKTYVLKSGSSELCGNSLIEKIENKIKDNIKIYAVAYSKEDCNAICEAVNGTIVSLSNIENIEFDNQCTLVDISDRDNMTNEDIQSSFKQMFEMLLKDICSTSCKKMLFLSNIYLFYDERYSNDDINKMLIGFFKNTRRYNCDIVITNWSEYDMNEFSKTILSQIKRVCPELKCS